MLTGIDVEDRGSCVHVYLISDYDVEALVRQGEHQTSLEKPLNPKSTYVLTEKW
jgi:hypothetical protein